MKDPILERAELRHQDFIHEADKARLVRQVTHHNGLLSSVRQVVGRRLVGKGQ